MPIFEEHCSVCHGTLGGWDASTYDSVISSGNNGPAVIPGDSENSLLVQKMLGTQTSGAIMPPAGKLSDSVIKVIIDWVDSGAQE